MRNEPTKQTVSFDALLCLALQENAAHALAALPTPDALKALYPDTSRWDARLHAALRRKKRRPLRALCRAAVVLAVSIALLSCTLLASAEVRYAVRDAIMEWGAKSVSLRYETEGEMPENLALPEGLTDHVVLDGFVLDEENSLDWADQKIHNYKSNDAEQDLWYSVTYYVITSSGQGVDFDDEHTVYHTIDLDGISATLGTSTSAFDGTTDYYLFWNENGIHYEVEGNVAVEEILKVGKGIY